MSDTNQAHEIDAVDDDAAFEAGFALVQGVDPASERSEPVNAADADSDEISTDETPADEAQPVEQQPEPEADPLEGLHPKVREALAELDRLKQVANRVNRIEGSLGGLQSHVKQLASTPKPASDQAPAPQGLTGEKWKRMQEEFPEIAEAMAEQLPNLMGGQTQINPDELASKVHEQVRAELEQKREAEAFEEIEEAHQGWSESLRTEQGQAWLKTLPQHELQEFMTTKRASKVIRYLDRFAEHQKQQQQAASVQSRRDAAARNAVTPQGGAKAGGVRREVDEDAAFEAGFSSVRGVRSR